VNVTLFNTHCLAVPIAIGSVSASHPVMLLSRKLSGCPRSDIALSICILYCLLCTLTPNKKTETINGKQQTTDYQLHKTSRYNSLALGCSRITRSDSLFRICILYFWLCTLMRNNKPETINGKQQTTNCQLHKTSRYNSLALGCSRITRSDSLLRVCILYFWLCTLMRNNKSAITNSSITTAYCQQDCASWNFRSTF